MKQVFGRQCLGLGWNLPREVTILEAVLLLGTLLWPLGTRVLRSLCWNPSQNPSQNRQH